MPKYRRKTNIVDAIQYKGIDEYFEVVDWFANSNQTTLSAEEVLSYRWPIMLVCHPYKGCMAAEPGDYIMMGTDGYFYVCKKDVFLESYELEG